MEKSIWSSLVTDSRVSLLPVRDRLRGDTETDWMKTVPVSSRSSFPTIYFTEEFLYCNTHSRVH